MRNAIAYLNGRLISAEELALPVYDAGFVLGATVTEQVRTFNGRLFRLRKHLERFANSRRIAGIELAQTDDELFATAQRLAAANHALLAPGDDLALCVFATPGPYGPMAPADEMAPADAAGPTVAMHTYPLAFGSFADKYGRGQALVTSDVRQVPAASLPRELKCRSRMHYHLADRQAAQQEPGARALLLDADDTVLETTTANVLIYRESAGLLSPPRDKILPGISVAATLEIAAAMKLDCTYRDLSLDDVLTADEVLLTSTSVCVLPVTRVNGRAIGDGLRGGVFRRLLEGWCALGGVDVAAQAQQFTSRR